MRDKPTLRIPLGMLALCAGLVLYALGVMSAAPWIGQLPVLVQTVVYLLLGTIWVIPLRRFLVWMETGHWR